MTKFLMRVKDPYSLEVGFTLEQMTPLEGIIIIIDNSEH
jgi:hypothetical protein